MPRWIAPSPALVALPVAFAVPLGHAEALLLTPALLLIVVALDLLHPHPGRRADAQERVDLVGLRLWPAAQAVVLVSGLLRVAHGTASAGEAVGLTVAVGLAGGLVGMPAAHELMHRPTRVDRALAEWLLVLTGYTHFRIEHVARHHRCAGLLQDPATARLGESLYAFLARAVPSGVRDAWRLEAQRLRRLGRPAFDRRNAVLRGAALTVLLGVAMAAFAGPAGLAYFVGQCLVAVFVLETVNYVQHYGLVRDPAGEQPAAWNSDTPASNWLLLGLGRHSEHHRCSHRPHRQLRLPAGAPVLPTGLPGTGLLALLPPLWFAVMDPLVLYERARSPGAPADERIGPAR